MTKDFSYQVVIDEQNENRLKVDKFQNATPGNLLVHLLPNQKPALGIQKQEHKQISKGMNDQGRRYPRFDPITMSYTYLLSILIHGGKIMPKEIEPSWFPHHLKQNRNATCAYHDGYMGYYTEVCFTFNNKVQELPDLKLTV